MTTVEGEGLRNPGPIRVPVDLSEILVLRREAERRSTFRRYAQKASIWSRSSFGDKGFECVGGEIKGAAFAILIGLTGEYALCKYINQQLKTNRAMVDLDLKARGDGGKDLNLYGTSIQVKTRKRMDASNLIRRTNDSGYQFPLTCDAYVFCKWDRNPHVLLLGWAWKRDVEQWPIRPAKFGKHTNYEAEDEMLLPMVRLATYLRTQRDMENDRGAD